MGACFPGKYVFTLFELLDEDCRGCSLIYNLIDEENDDEEGRNIVNFLKFCRFFGLFLFYMRRKSPKFYERPPLLNAPLY